MSSVRVHPGVGQSADPGRSISLPVDDAKLRDVCSVIAAPTITFCNSGVYHPASKMAAAALAQTVPHSEGRASDRAGSVLWVRLRGGLWRKVVASVVGVAVVAVATVAAAGVLTHVDSGRGAAAVPHAAARCAAHAAANACAMEYAAVVQQNSTYALGDYDSTVSGGAEYAAVFAGLVGMPASCNARVRALWCRATMPACDGANACAAIRPCLSDCFDVWAGCAFVPSSRISSAVGAALASVPPELMADLAATHGSQGAANLLALVRGVAACDAALYERDGVCWRATSPPPAAALGLESTSACVSAV